jgi:hypothetical protein
LARIVSRRFDAGGPFGKPGLEIISDLADSYGIPFPPEQFTSGRRTTFTEMVSTLVDDLTDEDDPVGLVVLAHGVADAEPQWPACYLAGVLPGEPLAFAVADDGFVTPFIALRIAAEYCRADGLRRAAVVILDQTSLLHGDEVNPDAPVPEANQVAMLMFGGSGGAVSMEMRVGVSPQDAGAELIPEPGTMTVVGGGFAAASGIRPVSNVVVAPAGLPCTGLWVEVAQGWEKWRSDGYSRVVVVDYDPTLRILGRCVIEL